MTHRLATASADFAAPAAARGMALGLAALVTLALLAGLGGIADSQVDDVLLAQAHLLPTQAGVAGQAPARG